MLTTLVVTPFFSYARSIHRPQDPQMPSIVTHWKDDNKKCYSLRSPFLEGYPFLRYLIKKHFDEHIMPQVQFHSVMIRQNRSTAPS
jgi:hypothetical protein